MPCALKRITLWAKFGPQTRVWHLSSRPGMGNRWVAGHVPSYAFYSYAYTQVFKIDVLRPFAQCFKSCFSKERNTLRLQRHCDAFFPLHEVGKQNTPTKSKRWPNPALDSPSQLTALPVVDVQRSSMETRRPRNRRWPHLLSSSCQ